VRLTTRRCGDKAPVKEKGYLKFLYVALARPLQHSRGQIIRTVLVLLGSLLLSSWFSSGIGAKGRARLAAWCIIRARFLAILVKGELNG
jgi:hypothetical protein